MNLVHIYTEQLAARAGERRGILFSSSGECLIVNVLGYTRRTTHTRTKAWSTVLV